MESFAAIRGYQLKTTFYSTLSHDQVIFAEDEEDIYYLVRQLDDASNNLVLAINIKKLNI